MELFQLGEREMRKLILLSSLIITLFSAVLYTATGTPSTLIVKTDATNALLVTAATQVNPVTSGVFASRRLSTDASGNLIVVLAGGGVAPVDATYITQTPDATLTNEQALSTLASGIMRVATTTGVVTSLTTSADIAANISDETGTGLLVFATSPVLTTPNLGTPSALVLTNATGLPAASVLAGTFGSGAFTFVGGILTSPRHNILTTATGTTSETWFRISNVDHELFNISLATDVTLTLGKTGIVNGAIYTPANVIYFGVNNTAEVTVSASAWYPQTSLGNSLGISSNIWLESYIATYYRGSTLLISGTAPSVPVACTSPAISWSNGTATFQIDVGTSCAGVTTLSFTMPASTNGWECTASNTTTAARDVWATAWTTTSVTLTNTARTTGLATDWADGADIRVKCMAG